MPGNDPFILCFVWAADSVWRVGSKDCSGQLIEAVTENMSEYSVMYRRQLIRSHCRAFSSSPPPPPLSFLILSLSHSLLFLSSLGTFPPACFKVTPAMKQIRQQNNYEYICILLLIRTFVIAAANLFCRDNFKKLNQFERAWKWKAKATAVPE